MPFRNNPYFVNSLIAGIDAEEGASLYWLDYLGTLQRVTRGAHGYESSHFVKDLRFRICCLFVVGIIG